MEDRIELLRRAREAKKAKQEARKAEKEANPPPRGRPKKPKPEEKTLDLVDNNQVKDEELDDILKPEPEPEISKRTTKKEKVVPQQVQEQEQEAQIVEEVEVRKVRKPKKRIVRKIIKEQYDSDSTDVSYEEVIYTAPKHRPRQAKAKEVEKPRPPTPPREPEVRESKLSLNIFGY